MRILYITQWFTPEPVCKGLSFPQALAARGHEVQVLTGYPNYPVGTVYPGYRNRWISREDHGAVRVWRVPLYPSHDRNPIRRALNYLSFAFSAVIAGLFRVGKFDVAYVYHPPATVGLAGALICRLRRKPFVYDIQDLWPDSVAQSGMLSQPTVMRLIGACCRLIYRSAAHIVVLSHGFRRMLLSRGVPEQKITVIHNWCDEEAIRAAAADAALARRLGMEGKVNVVFAGNMGKVQALETLLQAAALLRDEPQVQFLLVGDGTDRPALQRAAEQQGLENVRFVERMPMSEVGGVLSLADALLVHLEDDPLFRITIPSKTQAYLCVGKPILMGVAGDAAAIVERHRAGICFASSNPEAMAEAVRSFLRLSPEERRQMGERARAAYVEEMSLQVGTAKTEAVLERVINERCKRRYGETEPLSQTDL